MRWGGHIQALVCLHTKSIRKVILRRVLSQENGALLPQADPA
jgi:hypothetical protein